MGQISFVLDDMLDKTLRDVLGKKHGYKRGHMKECLTEAIEKWLRDMKKEEPKLFKDIDLDKIFEEISDKT